MQRNQKIHSGILVLLLATAAAQAAGPKQGAPPPLPVWPPGSSAPGHSRQSNPQKPQARTRPQEQPVYRRSNQDPRYGRNHHQVVWQQHRARSWENEHRGWRERGGYRGHRIPEQQYHVRFGPTHLFRLRYYPVGIVGSYIHFQYGGFGFSVIDPLPEYWSDNWYEDDDMYIMDADDGYYMHNRRYPQDRIAISVSIR